MIPHIATLFIYPDSDKSPLFKRLEIPTIENAWRSDICHLDYICQHGSYLSLRYRLYKLAVAPLTIPLPGAPIDMNKSFICMQH